MGRKGESYVSNVRKDNAENFYFFHLFFLIINDEEKKSIRGKKESIYTENFPFLFRFYFLDNFSEYSFNGLGIKKLNYVFKVYLFIHQFLKIRRRRVTQK
jgi:hypothetical protein